MKKKVTNPTTQQSNTQTTTKNKGVLPTLQTNINDGLDYQRRMLNFENTRGSSSGGGVSNYGFTGQVMKGYFDKETGNKEEKSLKVIDKYIIGTDKSTSKSILKDLGVDRKIFNNLPTEVKEQLVNWKFNTGRSVADLIYMASGKDKSFTGYKSHRSNSKTPSDLSNIDISNLTKTQLNKARKELYEGRIESMKDLLKEGKITKSELDFAIEGYNNSQKFRLQ
tara:strand:+ start:2871 stop:3539 length:669 start_codon:yes stop_codon:yes gene_type:complete